jgi:hypothetical protein
LGIKRIHKLAAGHSWRTALGLCLLFSAAPIFYGQDSHDLDQYRWRATAFW